MSALRCWWDNFRRWRKFRRAERHVKWLRKQRVMMLKAPHHTCKVVGGRR